MVKIANPRRPDRRSAGRALLACRRRHAGRVSQARKHRSTQAVAVFGGDETCLRAVLRRWTGQPVKNLAGFEGPLFIPGGAGGKYAVVLSGSEEPLATWPGGPLVWLFPERGPSQAELGQLRTVIDAHLKDDHDLVIAICLPGDLTEEQAVQDLEIIERTINLGLPAERTYTLLALWLDDDQQPNLRSFLNELEEQR